MKRHFIKALSKSEKALSESEKSLADQKAENERLMQLLKEHNIEIN